MEGDDMPKVTSLSVVEDSNQQPISLPSANVAHATVYENETQLRLSGFESGIIALQAELEGQEAHYRESVDELTDKHNKAKTELLKRIEDLQTGKRMAAAALDAKALR